MSNNNTYTQGNAITPKKYLELLQAQSDNLKMLLGNADFGVKRFGESDDTLLNYKMDKLTPHFNNIFFNSKYNMMDINYQYVVGIVGCIEISYNGLQNLLPISGNYSDATKEIIDMYSKKVSHAMTYKYKIDPTTNRFTSEIHTALSFSDAFGYTGIRCAHNYADKHKKKLSIEKKIIDNNPLQSSSHSSRVSKRSERDDSGRCQIM